MTRTLLFLCTGNYYRSRYAEMLFNANKPAALLWRAISRGFDPSPFNPGPIAAVTLERLRLRGHTEPIQVDMPRRLTEADLREANRIIALDETTGNFLRVVTATGLDLPSSLTFGPGGFLYATNFGAYAGPGSKASVVKIDVTTGL